MSLKKSDILAQQIAKAERQLAATEAKQNELARQAQIERQKKRTAEKAVVVKKEGEKKPGVGEKKAAAVEGETKKKRKAEVEGGEEVVYVGSKKPKVELSPSLDCVRCIKKNINCVWSAGSSTQTACQPCSKAKVNCKRAVKARPAPDSAPTPISAPEPILAPSEPAAASDSSSDVPALLGEIGWALIREFRIYRNQLLAEVKGCRAELAHMSEALVAMHSVVEDRFELQGQPRSSEVSSEDDVESLLEEVERLQEEMEVKGEGKAEDDDEDEGEVSSNLLPE